MNQLFISIQNDLINYYNIFTSLSVHVHIVILVQFRHYVFLVNGKVFKNTFSQEIRYVRE